MNYKRRYTDEQLKEIVPKCQSYSEVLRAFGLAIYGANHLNIKRAIAALNIDTSHFLGQGHARGRHMASNSPIRPINEFLVLNGPPIVSSRLKKRLLREGLIKNECAICKNDGTWKEKFLSLHLDHINGNSSDNRIENIRMLCPNCHSQTETYCRSKKSFENKEKRIIMFGARIVKERITQPSVLRKTCPSCNAATILMCSKICKTCHIEKLKAMPRKPQKDWPSLQEVIERLKHSNYSKLAKELGVSDNAIRKFLNRNHISVVTLEPLPKPI